MAKISRADWAASVPWSGITGKPSAFGPTDISELTANGYVNGQYPSAVSQRLKPTTLVLPPAPTPDPVPPAPASISKLYVTWDMPTLHALQTAQEEFTFIGANPGMAVLVGGPLDTTFVNLSAYCYDFNQVRILATNLGLTDIDVGELTYQLVIFP